MATLGRSAGAGMCGWRPGLVDSSPPSLLLLWPGMAGVRPWDWTGHCQGGWDGVCSAGVELDRSDVLDDGTDGFGV